ncbi:HAMP domain-containing sensor histidine kinase [Conexibacter sp. SYSU D00693]|uniref:sensor histidine kinase n=1 Tax=Conexibacter sp. SYSU D00693 TaxID=2812560 RepID=UPI00196B1B24|nr:HAMP domain-containing sensor histidine kinase [Conexibacter sp. SYSU D00693]
MRRGALLGLRGRLALALVATAIATLAVAALALLSPLQDRLREQSRESVRAATLSLRPQLEDLLARERGIGADVTDAVFDLAARTNSRAMLIPATPFVQTDRRLDTETSRPRFDDVYEVFIGDPPRTVESVTDEGTRIAVPLRVRDRDLWVLAVRKPERDIDAVFGEVRDAFLTAALVGLGVALLLGAALSSTLSRRLGRLRAVALRLAEQGPDAPPPTDRGQDEIGDLARAFTAMQVALRRQEAARRAFVATASHELRTPLTSLQGTMELLEEDLALDEVDVRDARTQIGAARGELRRLGVLATELLELSRLDAGVELHPEPVELGELVRAVSAEFVLRAREAGVTVEAVPPPAPVWARADASAVARVVRILLDNALRFSPAGTTVRVEPAYHGDRATLEVTDQGPGVPDDERDAIFERFRRGTRTGGEGGFGLGLAIGRELATGMSGTLVLADADGGAPGARFVLALPPAPPGG